LTFPVALCHSFALCDWVFALYMLRLGRLLIAGSAMAAAGGLQQQGAGLAVNGRGRDWQLGEAALRWVGLFAKCYGGVLAQRITKMFRLGRLLIAGIAMAAAETGSWVKHR
jgi:hypothetical protein